MKVLLDLNVALDVILNRETGQLRKQATADELQQAIELQCIFRKHPSCATKKVQKETT